MTKKFLTRYQDYECLDYLMNWNCIEKNNLVLLVATSNQRNNTSYDMQKTNQFIKALQINQEKIDVSKMTIRLINDFIQVAYHYVQDIKIINPILAPDMSLEELGVTTYLDANIIDDAGNLASLKKFIENFSEKHISDYIYLRMFDNNNLQVVVVIRDYLKDPGDTSPETIIDNEKGD